METYTVKSIAILVVCGCLCCSGRAQAQTVEGPLAGEIRAFAVDTSDSEAMTTLHRAGWLEAAGQVLSVQDFPEAFRMIRRSWTSNRVPADHFAVPDLRRLSRTPDEIDETTAQLLGGDRVTSGSSSKGRASARLLYCVYLGRDAAK